MSRILSSRRRTVRRALTTVTVVGLLGAAAVPASAGRSPAAVTEDDPPPANVLNSAAGAYALETGLLGVATPLWTSRTMSAETPGQHGGSDPVRTTHLPSLPQVTVGGASVPLAGEGGLLDLAAVHDVWHVWASAEGARAYAAAGLVGGPNGAIDLRPVTDPADTSLYGVDLTPVLPQLGVGAAVDDVRVGLGALASRVEQVAGEEPDVQYVVGGADLTLTVPSLTGVPAAFDAAVTQAETALTTSLGPGGPVERAVTGLRLPSTDLRVPVLGKVGRLDLHSPTLTTRVDLSAARRALPPVLTDPDGLVRLDLRTGAVRVDLARLHDDDLSALPPDTPLLDDAQAARITDVTTGLLTRATTALHDAVAGTPVTVGLDATATAAGRPLSGDVSVTATTTLGALLDRSTAEVDVLVDGTLTVRVPLLGRLTVPLPALRGAVVRSLVDGLADAAAAPLADLLDEDGRLDPDVTAGPVADVVGALRPALTALLGPGLDVTVNSRGNPGPLGGGSVTVRPVLVEVLPGAPGGGVPIALASSSVRVPAAHPTAPYVRMIDSGSGPTRGGGVLRLAGERLDQVTEVWFGDQPGTDVTVTWEGVVLEATSPTSEVAGRVPVVLVTPEGRWSAGTFFYVAPEIWSVEPPSGPGTESVRLAGRGLEDATRVTFGGVDVIQISSANVSGLHVRTPALYATDGPVPIVVELPGMDAVLEDGFTFTDPRPPLLHRVSPTQGPPEGGTEVQIDGQWLWTVTEVTFNGVPGTDLTIAPHGGQLTVVTPPLAPGTAQGYVDMLVHSPWGTWRDSWKYLVPEVYGVSPRTGPPEGGTEVVINGLMLDQADGVTFGGVPAASWHVEDPQRIVAVTPPGELGEVEVAVTFPDGAVRPTRFPFRYYVSPWSAPLATPADD